MYTSSSITTQQMYDTVLMRYGNRQGNTALQAQCVIELDLLKDELFNIVGLPSSSIRLVDVAVGPQIQFPMSDALFADQGLQFPIRFAGPDHYGSTVTLIYNNTTGELMWKPLELLTLEERNELLTEANYPNLAADMPTHYYVEYDATVVTLWPSINSGNSYSARFAIHDGLLLAQQLPTELLLSGLGVRMGRYIKDADELNAFRAEYARALDTWHKRLVEIEQDFKYGNRGAN